jgi:hypothetical protein
MNANQRHFDAPSAFGKVAFRPSLWLDKSASWSHRHQESMPSAQKMNLRIGEDIDFFRTPGSKDASAWYGPATVVDVSKAGRGVF